MSIVKVTLWLSFNEKINLQKERLTPHKLLWGNLRQNWSKMLRSMEKIIYSRAKHWKKVSCCMSLCLFQCSLTLLTFKYRKSMITIFQVASQINCTGFCPGLGDGQALVWGSYRGGFCDKLLEASYMSGRASPRRLQAGCATGWSQDN